MAENAADGLGVGWWDAARSAFEGSPGLARLFGLAAPLGDDALLRLRGAVHPDDAARAAAAAIQLMQTGHAPPCDFRVRWPDGAVRHLRAVGVTAGGRITVTVEDVTDAVRRAAVHERDAQMHRMAEALAGVGSYRWAPRTGELVWSAQFRRIIGVGPDVPASFDGFAQRLPAEDRQRLQDSTQRALTTGATESLPVTLRRDDGSTRQLIFEGRFVEGGELVGSVLDVTELRRLQNDLFQAQKVEALGRLAGGVAHDFNNILAVLRLGLESRATPAVMLSTAIERGAALTRQLLAFSRKSALEPRTFDAIDLLRQSVSLVERLLGDAVRVQLADAAGALSVHADPSQLQHALINLMVNARDAMPRGGTIWVSAQRRPFAQPPPGVTPALQPGRYVQIEIRDEGTGIDPSVLPHIFEPFFTTKREGEGTGLGLASVHGLLHQSNGGLSVESQPGAGTTFRLFLPERVDAAAGVAPAAGGARPRGGGERILVIDDLPELRRSLSAMLQHAGYEAVGLDDFERLTADPAAVARSCAAVMTDVDMPRFSGPEVAGLLWRHVPRLPVLFISGHAPPALGPLPARTAFLAKPFSSAQAVEQLNALLRDSAD